MTAEFCELFHCRNERSWVITTLSCLIPLAGFEVSLIGRFSGVPRGLSSTQKPSTNSAVDSITTYEYAASEFSPHLHNVFYLHQLTFFSHAFFIYGRPPCARCRSHLGPGVRH